MLVRKERKDAIEHRRIILQKALSLFTEHGVDSVTMHQIAKSAGIGQGTLCRRYAHKGELCRDLMKDSSQKLCNDLESYLNNNKELPLQTRLAMVLQIYLDFIENHSQWLISIQAPTCEGRQSLIYQSPLFKFLHSTFHILLSESLPKVGDPLKDAAFMADVLIYSMNPELYLFLREGRGYSKEEIVNQLVGLYIDPLFL
jgi:AcrR family transcriptional regulator